MRITPLIKVSVDNLACINLKKRVKYLTLSEFQTKLLQKTNPEILETTPNESFVNFLQEEISNYLAGKEVDKAIAGAVMNCADMFACGEQITLRAGDYIALQNHHREMASPAVNSRRGRKHSNDYSIIADSNTAAFNHVVKPSAFIALRNCVHMQLFFMHPSAITRSVDIRSTAAAV